MKRLFKILTLFIFVVALSACPEPSENPTTPFLTMKYLYLSDTVDALENPVKRFTFVFDLLDGDGDVGLRTADTTGVFHPDSLYHYNCYLDMYDVNDNDTALVELNAPLQFRIPYLEPEGGNKNLEAEVFLDVDMTIGTQLLEYEYVLFELYIYDRSFNKSNTIQSPAVPFDGLGFYSANP